MHEIRNKVIVAAFCTFNSYGMLRTLSKNGIRPYLIIDRRLNATTARSKFGGEKIYFDSPVQVQDLLMQHFVNEVLPPIVICCDDAIQSAVDLQNNRLSPHFLLSNIGGQQGGITAMMDKEMQMEKASKAGVLTPRTWICPQGTTIPSDMVYPA